MAYRDREDVTTGNELFFFIIGVSVGVVAALLLAPYSGEETRQYLRERVDEGRERAGGMLDKGREFVGRGSIGESIAYDRKDVQEKS